MKRLTLKLKLTLLYTFFMLLVTCAALVILFSLSNRELLATVQDRLTHRVQNSADAVILRDNVPAVETDFYSVESDVYLSLYDETGYFLMGRIPHGFDSEPEIKDGQIRKLREGNTQWYVYDMSFRLSADQTVYIRGITSVTDAETSYRVTMRFALILLPGLTLATAFIGYRFTRRTLLPVRRITDTVQEIRADADLSRRIGLPESGGKNRDEIYHLAETFDEMLSQLDEVFRREKQFTSDVSHELRTPVSVIIAQCGACLTDETLTEEQREQICLIEKKAKEMAEMISQLLFLSRADQGRQPLEMEELDLSELTEMVVEERKFLIREQGLPVLLTSEVEPGIKRRADETLYIRMLGNLISNAVAYRKPEGQSKIHVSLTEKDQCIIGVVEDNGIGIREDALPYIWERFYREDAARTKGSHSGLGLSMVRWIVEMHGGNIRAESRKGEGSRFIFELSRTEK